MHLSSRKINVASRVKNAPPLAAMFHEDRTVNVASITNLVNKFHEDWAINVASRVKMPRHSNHRGRGGRPRSWWSTNPPINISVYARQHGQLTDKERETLLSTDWKPSEKHVYKKTQFGKTNRTFQSSWLQKYPGLVYRLEEDGAYCHLCSLSPHASVKDPFLRSIRALGLVKTKLRSSIGQDRLSALCQLSNVVREFARKHPRRMDIPDMMSEL
ncbi:hypothetical protein DPMN_132803 [Dreissena polymorpha]|uniref:TTF-type domain-containing protein n=1 Tax=Dreissena polymorpha TaxID=45954 RepID=A0A9D4J978_DREPO|nr:hypothetical protein DPMN_132803 [Dreissena polymorpha]